jgi:hypothetical protein
MTKVQNLRKKLLAALLVIAVVMAFSPLAAATAHAATSDLASNKATAKPIAAGGTYSGTFVNSDDYHWYKFTLPAPTPVTLQLKRTAMSGPTADQIFAEFDIYQDDGSSSGLLRDWEYLKANVAAVNLVANLPAGTFYLKVDPGTYVAAGSTNKYSFTFVNKGLLEKMYCPTEFRMDSKSGLTYVKKNLDVYSGGGSEISAGEYNVTMTNATKAGPSVVTVTGKNQHYGTFQFTVNKYLSQTYHSASANFKKKTITVKINTKKIFKVYGATGYIVKYKFPGKGWKSIKTKKATYTFKKVANLKNGKKFNFQTIAYAKVGKKTYYSRTYSSPAKAWYKTTHKVIVY